MLLKALRLLEDLLVHLIAIDRRIAVLGEQDDEVHFELGFDVGALAPGSIKDSFSCCSAWISSIISSENPSSTSLRSTSFSSRSLYLFTSAWNCLVKSTPLILLTFLKSSMARLRSPDGRTEPDKPKWMHWSTYDRELTRAIEYSDASWAFSVVKVLSMA
jgi:hypothetical protein